MSRYKANLDDGCNPELVKGCLFDLPMGIPIIKAPSKIYIPPNITPFSMRNRNQAKYEDALGFYEKDFHFGDVLAYPHNYVDDFGRFKALISPDCSLYRDAPLAVQLTNVYRNRAIGCFFQNKGLYVIPQIRWGNEYTYTKKYFPERIAFLGVEKRSIVAIGTYGCCLTKEDKYHLAAGLDAMMETVEPKVVLVYGSMPSLIFDQYHKYAKFIRYDDYTTRIHIQHNFSNLKDK